MTAKAARITEVWTCPRCGRNWAAEPMRCRCGRWKGDAPDTDDPAPLALPEQPASEAKRGPRGPRQPNRLEAAFRDWLFHCAGQEMRYEALSLRLPGGGRYTPDWVLIVNGAPHAVYEVKGPWESRDARIRWQESAAAWPGISHYWATRDKAGQWTLTEYEAAERR